MTILSFDPGGTTGYATCDKDYNIVSGHFAHFEDVNSLLLSVKPSIIIVESFALYPWKSKHKQWSSFPEVEVIGAIKHEAYLHGLQIIEQTPSTKQLFDDKKLKQLGLYKQISNHARDAVRHILYYQTTGGDYHWLKLLRS